MPKSPHAATEEQIKPNKESSIENQKSEHKLSRLEIEIHRGPKGEVTGHTVHHEFEPKSTKSGAFMERPPRASYPFGADGHSHEHGHIAEHISKHLGIKAPKGMVEVENKPGEDDDEEVNNVG